ncbi:MAG: hypothetical protein ACLR09_02595 [Gallintestinimicrobium sp.]
MDRAPAEWRFLWKQIRKSGQRRHLDLDCVAAVEAECFPAAEAASKEEFAERIAAYGNHFWLLFENGKLVSFVDGMADGYAGSGG